MGDSGALPKIRLVELFEKFVLGVQGLGIEKVVAILKQRKQEIERGKEMDAVYENLEEVKIKGKDKDKDKSFWKLNEKTVKELEKGKFVLKKFFHDRRKVLLEKWAKTVRIVKDIEGLNEEKEWLEKHSGKVEKIRKRITVLGKLDIRIQNEERKKAKYFELLEKEKDKKAKKEAELKRKQEKQAEQEKRKQLNEERKLKRKEEILKEKQRQKKLQAEKSLHREKLKQLQKEKEREKEKEKEKNLLSKKNSSMMDFFNQTKNEKGLKKVKTDDQQGMRWVSLGSAQTFGKVNSQAIANLDVFIGTNNHSFESDILQQMKTIKRSSTLIKETSEILPEMKLEKLYSDTEPNQPKVRLVFNRFEDYLGTVIERKGKFSLRSKLINGRRPVQMDTIVFNYEMDTEDELQELEAESCKSFESGEEGYDEALEEEDKDFVVEDETKVNGNRIIGRQFMVVSSNDQLYWSC